MKKFVMGFITGVIATAVGGAMAAKIVGENGYLQGWTVEVDGEEVCSEPYIWTSIKQIECD